MEGQLHSHAATASLPPSGRRKAKGKAPLPPSNLRQIDVSSETKTIEPINLTMEQKENITDRDIELLVVLPEGEEKLATVHGSKPIMDLFIFFCGKYHLNPSSHSVELVSADKNQIKFKPNTLIGTLEVQKIILKPKNLDEKNRKPTIVVPEQTVRVVINYKKTQKTIVRVSPSISLQKLIPVIGEKCEFDEKHTVLLRDYQSQEHLDLTKSLNELGLRELYAMDTSREPCQTLQNTDTILKEKDNKGFFNLFRRSRKKQEQTTSAPTTPSLSQQRPVAISLHSSQLTQFDSSTLTSGMPKKRRAPLPPISTSQSVPKDLSQVQERPASCVVQSIAVDGSEQNLPGLGRARTGSLQLRRSTSSNSSLKRNKRKAPSPPSPPSKMPQDQSNLLNKTDEFVDETPKIGIVPEAPGENVSEESDRTSSPLAIRGTVSLGSPNSDQGSVLELTEANLSSYTDTAEMPLKPRTGLDHSLEIHEKQETRVPEKDGGDDSANILQEVSSTCNSISLQSGMGRNESASACSSEDENRSMEASEISKGEKEESISTNSKVLCDSRGDLIKHNVADPKTADLSECGDFENKHVETSLDVQTDSTSIYQINKEEGLQEERLDGVENVKESYITENSKPVVEEKICYQTCNKELAVIQRVKPNRVVESLKQAVNVIESVVAQDAAVQATPSNDSIGITHDKLVTKNDFLQHAQPCISQDKKYMAYQNTDMSLALQDSNSENQVVRDSIGIKEEKLPTDHDPVLTLEKSSVDQSNTSIKSLPIYKRDSEPKPKPSNEVTRDYIPKIGLTTYKIVPPKSLEKLRDFEVKTMQVDIQTPPKNTSASSNSEPYMTTEVPDESKLPMGVPSASALSSRPDSSVMRELAVKLKEKVDTTNSVACSNATDVQDKNQNPNNLSKPVISKTSSVFKDSQPTASVQLQNKSVIPLEGNEKPIILGPKMKPGSFYLQLQKRTSGLYVTSAIAKNKNSLSQNIDKENASLPLPEKSTVCTDEIFPPPPEFAEKHSEHLKEKVSEKLSSSGTSTLKESRPLSFPSKQLNFQKLRTFATPRPYSSTSPSPFALAVSSAVKKSQSFKGHAINSQPSRVDSANIHSAAENLKDSSSISSSSMESSDQFNRLKRMSVCETTEDVDETQHLQTQSLHCPDGQKPVSACQNSDLDQIRQNLLEAIRSGDGAAKLRKVPTSSNTVSFNGSLALNHSISSQTQ
ncbi:cordon-bleu protein-like 1b isoform X3 [Latimeria chalumnae]|uniref:cordon-bleu protein-like 1b isoform X3 n=1 Tax=Latimeria chalumnae TaxID=7897 RepID=UPI0003C10680|nr:PREDICTED: cordon-bleu protein-like 1 isoform X3 [Latimeria chalumnae]|eukprot:XP_006003656.1 PREDICTED: cordon-bleu protein-like 1 isoform X3 [Latimeria chalumnae]